MLDMEQKTIKVIFGLDIRTALLIAAMPMIVFSSYRIAESAFSQNPENGLIEEHAKATKQSSYNTTNSVIANSNNNTVDDLPSNDGNTPTNQEEQDAIRKYKERMKAATNEAAANESKKTVDINQIKNSYASIEYKGVVFNKIGFMSDGSLMESDKIKAQVSETYKKLIEKGDDWYIKFPAKGQEIAGIFVFSDPTCGFCKKLHNAIPELNSKGITVNYLMYPRMLPLGSNNPEAKKVIDGFRTAWCSSDRTEGFERLYSGQFGSGANCQNTKSKGEFPLFEHFFFGQLFNVQGTPAFFSSTGIKKEGFSTADKLISQILEKK